MAFTRSRFGVALFLSLNVAASMAACGGGKGTATTKGDTSTFSSTSTSSGMATASNGSGAGGNSGNGGNSGQGGGIVIATSSNSGAGGSAVQGFDVEPSTLQTVDVTVGTAATPITYTAKLNGALAPATGWGVDQGNLGTLSAATGSSVTFTPSGNAGGLINITAALNTMTAQRQVMIKLHATQNGANTSNASEMSQIPANGAALTAGGGVGGVGGTGLGPAVTDQPTLTALGAPTGDGTAQGLAFVYPYDNTVFPRGLPAPLLQWTWTPPGGAYPGDADAIQITLATANGSFSYTGTFARPAILSTVPGSFINHPIPQDIWDIATNSAGGTTNPLTVTLVVAKGGVAYGPITQTYTIAPARLPGIIYYQSYGTQLAQNLCCNIGSTTSRFGGAVLSIHVGDTGPQIAAGGTSTTNSTGCRVCHSVASSGTILTAVDGDNEAVSTAYSLSSMGITSQVMTHLAVYPAIYPDGTMALTSGGVLLPLPTDTTPITTTGLTNVTTNLGQPAFSPDGTFVAFNPAAGSLKLNQTLYVIPFDKTTFTFGTPLLVADDTGSAAQVKPGWPAFFPDSKSIVYHHQSITGVENDLGTRAGNEAQIYWTSLQSASDVTPLDNLNGKGYLPKLPAKSTMTCTADGYSVAVNPSNGIQPNLDHSDDVDMNYEPTVNPIASGGYAWVVFTSRRMYGNVATIPPFCSDPRGVNLTANTASPLATNITTKKLWVAAIDLTQKAGFDSSHPAFYLPAQELLAGNARGFWTLDPCQADGMSCMTGDQCCGGYCEANGDGGALICSNTQPMGMCSGLQDKCTTSADCCDSTNICLNGFCSQQSPSHKPPPQR